MLQRKVIRTHKRALCRFKERHWSLVHTLSEFNLMSSLFFLFVIGRTSFCHVLVLKIVSAKVWAALLIDSSFTKGDALGACSVVGLGVQICSRWLIEAESWLGAEKLRRCLMETLEIHIVLIASLCLLLLVLAFNLSCEKRFFIRFNCQLLDHLCAGSLECTHITLANVRFIDTYSLLG